MAKKKKIKLAIKEVIKLKWRDLQPFQPDDLKVMTADEFQKLQNNIEYNDFDTVPYVWYGEGEYWLLDGHHRKYALEAMVSKGFDVPEELYCAVIDVNTRKEANEKLLDYSSNHAKIDEQGFLEFCHVNGLDLNTMSNRLSLPGIKIDLLSKHNQDFEINPPDEKPIKDQTEFIVLINCNNEREQQTIYEEMEKRGFQCKLIM